MKKILLPGQRVWELDEGEWLPSAFRQEALEGGNGSRVRTLLAATAPTKYRNKSILAITNLFALGIRDCQGPFDGLWISVRSVNLFPEHSGKLLDLEFCPVDEGYSRNT